MVSLLWYSKLNPLTRTEKRQSQSTMWSFGFELLDRGLLAKNGLANSERAPYFKTFSPTPPDKSVPPTNEPNSVGGHGKLR